MSTTPFDPIGPMAAATTGNVPGQEYSPWYGYVALAAFNHAWTIVWDGIIWMDMTL